MIQLLHIPLITITANVKDEMNYQKVKTKYFSIHLFIKYPNIFFVPLPLFHHNISTIHTHDLLHLFVFLAF